MNGEPRPATRVGNVILFPGGRVKKISMIERILFKLKIKKTSIDSAPYSPGWELGSFFVTSSVSGTGNRYRKGWVIYYGRKRLLFIPTGRSRSFLT